MSVGDNHAFDQLAPEERKVVEYILRELRREGKSKTLDALWELDYEQTPVSIDRFLDDDYYLGKIGVSLFPLWRKELRYVHDPKYEIGELIVRGAIGTGKTTIAVISLLYKIHHLICLKDPQRYYSLMEGSPIVFGLFNIFKYLAQDTSYKYFTNWIKLSGFFQDAMRKAYNQERTLPGWLQRLNRMYGIDNSDLAQSYMRFPKHITMALGSQAIHALGQNLFGGLCDEADMGRNKAITDQDKSQVAELYGQARSRMDSRFMQKGGVNPGILILVSQVRHRDSFLEKHVAKVRSDKRTHIVSYPIWEMKSHLHPPEEEKFTVVIGDQRIRSFIIEKDEQGNLTKEIPQNVQVIEVPESLRPRFEYHLDDAIRDLAGIATYGSDLFLPRRDRLFECYSRCSPRQHPFTSDAIELSIEVDDVAAIADYFVKEECMRQHDKATGAWKPRHYPHIDRAVHVDLALNGDCAGIAMGCIGDVKRVQRFDIDGRPYAAQDYNVFVDFALRISAVRGSEIDFSKIRAFVYYLHAIGFPIKWVSYDGWQSLDSQQQFKKAGYEVKTLSVDKKPIPYGYLRSTVYELRLDFYDYDPFTEEMTKLQDRSRIKGAKPPINHPPGGCLVGETRIPLLDGTYRTIAELDGKEVVDGTIVPGLARGRTTKEVLELVDVILDTGAVVRCTPEHPWMLRDGTYKPACELTPNLDRLMPIRWAYPVNGGYERLVGKDGVKILTHHMVMKHFSPGSFKFVGNNHKVKAVALVKLDEPVPVYDLEEYFFDNFALCAGIFVHNSKDVSDAVCGVVCRLTEEKGLLRPQIDDKTLKSRLEATRQVRRDPMKHIKDRKWLVGDLQKANQNPLEHLFSQDD
jgi:hypothetical protein